MFDPTAGMQGWQAPPVLDQDQSMDMDDGDSSHRPPNAFILYSQAMRSSVRQDNPSLSNTEVSRLLGKMWKEVPNDTKLQYKQKAAKLQEDFKKQHPDYTYRKARRKRALNELLTKSTQGFPGPGYPMDPMALQAMMSNPAMMAQGPGMFSMMGQMPPQNGQQQQGQGQMQFSQQSSFGQPQGMQQMSGMGQIPNMGQMPGQNMFFGSSYNQQS